MTARQGDHLPGIEFQQSESDHERENNRFGPAEKGDRYDDFKKMENMVANSSAIRAMFEEGNRLAKLYGKENVYDFSLGNPNVPRQRQ